MLPGIGYLDDKVIMSGDSQPGPNMITQIDQFLDLPTDDILFRFTFRFDGDSFRPE